MSESHDINVRGIDTEYGPVIAQQVKKELDTETVLLRKITVTVQHERRKSGDIYNDYFDVVFLANHDRRVIETSSVTDSHGDLDTLSFDVMLRVTRTAESAVESYLDTIDHPYGLSRLADSAVQSETYGVDVGVFVDQSEI